MFLRHRDLLLEIRDKITDEGDRCYFGSTNHADYLRDVAAEIDDYAWDRYMRATKWPDYIDSSRKANARADSAESRLTTALAALERLASAKLLSQIRPLVAGWNGENLPPEKRYGRHHAELGVTLRTNTGEVYAIDEAIVEARATLAKLNALEGNEDG